MDFRLVYVFPIAMPNGYAFISKYINICVSVCICIYMNSIYGIWYVCICVYYYVYIVYHICIDILVK